VENGPGFLHNGLQYRWLKGRKRVSVPSLLDRPAAWGYDQPGPEMEWLQKSKGDQGMTLKEYFEKTTGVGVLATADGKGAVDAALYARPHVIDEETIALIMSDRLSHLNLQSNPRAVYLFKEADGNRGRRLYLTKTKEEKDSPLIPEIRRRSYPEVAGKYEGESKFLVYFRIDRTLPLIGGEK
jgi:hypothetical protein